MKTTEQNVNVGIVRASNISFTLNGEYTANDGVFSGRQTVSYADGRISWMGKEYEELLFVPQTEDCSFSLEDVVIGVNFHWERKQTQTFLGTLRFIVDGEKIQVINTLPVERYLESVISSEMSATSSLELLKAHAVISRSWLLSQIENRGKAKLQPSQESDAMVREQTGDTIRIIRWYDREDHQLFDVCADDHCQRYQGITNSANKHVLEAVRATHGQILTYDGEICDTRFAKCCGGITEEYRYCWENINKPYLKSVHDPYCNTHDTAVLAEVLNDYDQETQDFYDWFVSYTQQELSALIERKQGIHIGRVRHIEALEKGLSGRISLLKITGEYKTLIIGKELEIRKTLSDTHLYSSAFTVHEQDADADGFPTRFVFNGRGWGHGVGLCQIGAAVMGARGVSYDDILSYYYVGAKLEKAY